MSLGEKGKKPPLSVVIPLQKGKATRLGGPNTPTTERPKQSRDSQGKELSTHSCKLRGDGDEDNYDNNDDRNLMTFLHKMLERKA